MLYRIKPLFRKLIPLWLHPAITSMYLGLMKLGYKGDSVDCPWCECSYRIFPHFEDSDPPEYICPGCGTLGRHRLLWFYLKRETNIHSNELKILHFAPEVIILQRLSALPNLSYVSTDIISPLAMVKTDITNLSFESEVFDIILCSHVLDVVQDDVKGISEIYRVLKPGGIALIQSWVDTNRQVTDYEENIISPSEKRKRYGHREVLRRYGMDFESKLKSVGFEVASLRYATTLTESEITKFALPVSECIYRCEKN